MLFDLFHAAWLCESPWYFQKLGHSFMGLSPILALKIYFEILPEQIINEKWYLAFRTLSITAPKSWTACG